ncbi:PilN domain-containing protein [Sphaerotilus sp.]|uniref:PilN domain-containing protein n=1 Tax=Sphaerotilus sp. TaxID=2093942 RepID=UPI0034E1C46C
MSQQLNLYARSLCQSRQANALGHMLLLQGALAALAMVIGTGLQWHTRQIHQDTLQLAAQADVRRSALLPSAASRTEQAERDQVKRLRDHEAAVQRLQGLLDNGSAGRREGYADHLEALARQTHPAVWITGLTLQGGDDAIEIRGRMTDPAVLPDYLRSLQAEPRFRGRTFATLQIRSGGAGSQATDGVEPTDKPDYSEFTLSSQAPRTEPAKP